MSNAEPSIGDYGLDAPRFVATLGFLGTLGLLVTIGAGVLDRLLVMAGAFAFTLVISSVGLLVVRASRVHKLRLRVKLVDRLGLVGHERVLDVGYGRGLLLLEAARRMHDGGRVIGIDVWRSAERVGHHPDTALDNADREAVIHRVDISHADARALPFAAGSFDAVVSSQSPHHIHDHDARVNAIREIDRVLVPGGRVVLISHHTLDYLYALRSCNWTDVKRSRLLLRMFPPLRYVIGAKPAPNVIAASSDVADSAEEPTAADSEVTASDDTGVVEPDAEPAEAAAESAHAEPEVEEPMVETPVVEAAAVAAVAPVENEPSPNGGEPAPEPISAVPDAQREGDEGEVSAAATP
jgi:SAM-dependent methyltransferase